MLKVVFVFTIVIAIVSGALFYNSDSKVRQLLLLSCYYTAILCVCITAMLQIISSYL